ncbi:hypothetical protein E4U43_000302 [Claviceps pusilla]|uniref:Uncharacterized protein n=1 Tax=Claviceps pusilla TaxID=123648 RepID=A0A9P7N9U6_9HYPO|nr:hypothetical protein E4U43_000302 [Claviceps pusilla]
MVIMHYQNDMVSTNKSDLATDMSLLPTPFDLLNGDVVFWVSKQPRTRGVLPAYRAFGYSIHTYLHWDSLHSLRCVFTLELPTRSSNSSGIEHVSSEQGQFLRHAISYCDQNGLRGNGPGETANHVSDPQAKGHGRPRILVGYTDNVKAPRCLICRQVETGESSKSRHLGRQVQC